MATEARKRAIRKYRQTEEGREKHLESKRKSAKKWAQTEEGKQARKELEQTDARKEYRRLWMAEFRRKQKEEQGQVKE